MNTITVKYCGGLGNIMFEIATAIAYSVKLNRPLILSKYPAFPNLDNHCAESIGLCETEYASSLKEFSEDDIARGAPIPENCNVKLVGFCQHYQLFDQYKPQIFRILEIDRLRDSVFKTIKLRGLFSPDSTTISLHIRRGDYENLSCYFVILNEYYYKNALLYLIGQLKDQSSKINVLCFYEQNATESATKIIDALQNDSDLSFEFRHFNRILEGNVSDIEEMAIISHCKHHIIANSTYSWWSAYINPDPDKIVCYPDEYFNHQLYYLVNDGLKVAEWTSIKSWNPQKKRCGCYD